MKIAFVTGGTGFIGSHLVEELLQRGYDEVRCLIRSERKWLEGLDITPVRGELSDVELLWDALDGVTHVYHLGAITRAQDWETFEKNNVMATLDLLGAVKMAAPDIRRVLVMSSLAAVGRCDGGIASEQTPLNPISQYGKSKAEMEQALHERHDMADSFSDELPITIVRPPAVYGPRDRDIYTFFQTVNYGICPVVGGGSARLSLVHVQDLVAGIIAAAEAPQAAGETYFVGSDRGYTWHEVKQATTRALNRRAVTIPVPGVLIGAVGAVAELGGKLVGAYPPLNRDKAKEIRHACTVCSIEKARSEIGYRPRISLEEGIRGAIEWYRNEGWL